jgi:hypothetical protein
MRAEFGSYGLPSVIPQGFVTRIQYGRFGGEPVIPDADIPALKCYVMLNKALPRARKGKK